MVSDELRPPIVMEYLIRVDMGGGAHMQVPRGALGHTLRYGNAEGVDEVRYTAAAVIDCYRYLVEGCSLKEALRRLRLMRKAARAARVSGDDQS